MNTDVVVAGAGPVGLMVACELAARGIRTEVFERLLEPTDESRAQVLHGRTMPTLDRRALLDRFLAAERELNGGAASGRGKRPLPKGHFAGLTGLSFADHDTDLPRAAFVPQIVTARLLAERAAELGVTVHRGREVSGFSQDADGVTVLLDGGEPVRARFLIGCDGARSAVRARAGIAFPGTPATVDTVAGEVRLTSPDGVPSGWVRTPRGVTVMSVHPGGGVSRVVAIDFAGPSADRDAPVTAEELEATVSRIHGRPIPMTDLTAGQRYGDAARQAERYRAGRVFLAGDSAHIHYPVGGQGLNIGLQDAVNLGWKLAAELEGWAPPGLLDTYHAERHPVAASVLVHTRAQIALLHPDERVDALRAVFGELMKFEDVDRFLSDKITAADVRYGTGSHPLTGRFAPDLALVAGEKPLRLAETLHSGRPVLLDLVGRPELAEAAAPWADRVAFEAVACPDRPELGALLVRPDGYVAWAASSGAAGSEGLAGVAGSEGLAGALREWFGEPARA